MDTAESTDQPARRRRLAASRLGLAGLFIGSGVLHFAIEKFYVSIVPRSLPYKREIVHVSGAAEIAGGIGVLLPATRRAAGRGLIALLLAVFPANVQMALNPERYKRFAPWTLWARLPLQFIAIAWAWRATQND